MKSSSLTIVQQCKWLEDPSSAGVWALTAFPNASKLGMSNQNYSPSFVFCQMQSASGWLRASFLHWFSPLHLYLVAKQDPQAAKKCHDGFQLPISFSEAADKLLSMVYQRYLRDVNTSQRWGVNLGSSMCFLTCFPIRWHSPAARCPRLLSLSSEIHWVSSFNMIKVSEPVCRFFMRFKWINLRRHSLKK